MKKIVSEQPFVEEGLVKGIISIQSLSEQMLPSIEQELNKNIKLPAVVMALRRYSENIAEHGQKVRKFNYAAELLLKTNICDFTVVKSQSLLAKLKTVYNLVDFERGETLNVILGNNEVSVIINEKHADKLTKFLHGEKILNKEANLIALTIIFTADDFLHTPGIIFDIVRKLAWNGINIYEIVSTMTELTFILHKKDSMKAYNVLQELVSK